MRCTDIFVPIGISKQGTIGDDSLVDFKQRCYNIFDLVMYTKAP